MRALRDWLLTPERVAVHVPSGTAVIADPHFGYAEARCRAGEAVPTTSLLQSLVPLGQVLSRLGLHRLIVAGDLLEDGRGTGVLEGLSPWFATAGVNWCTVIPGNHDRGLAKGFGFSLAENGLQLGDWHIVHGDARLPRGQVVHGHEHPWAAWNARLGGPCFLVGPNRLILPAYSQDAAGVNVLGQRRWQTLRCCVIAGNEVLDFGPIDKLNLQPRWQ